MDQMPSSEFPHQSSRPDGMRADADDPLIGVHVLTEFVFCPRAGLLAFESNTEDTGEDPLPPRLDYLPRYDVRRMRREVKRLLRFFWLQLAALCGVGVFLWLFAGRGYLFVLLGVLGGLELLRSIRQTFGGISDLGRALRAAEGAEPRLPDVGATGHQPVNWWELLQAGFVSRQYADVLRDDDWKMAGRPWRVLAYGSLRIPVFRQHHSEGGLHQQHDVRMTAYCHLIECCTGMESPYGIILFGRTHEGVAIPNSPQTRKTFHDKLRAARNMIRELRSRERLPEPPFESRCQNCPLGFPLPIKGRQPQGASVYRGRRWRRYHSVCGDRCGWMPPHRRVQELNLRPPKK